MISSWREYPPFWSLRVRRAGWTERSFTVALFLLLAAGQPLVFFHVHGCCVCFRVRSCGCLFLLSKVLSEKLQDGMSAKKLQLVVDAVGLGKLDEAEVRKKNIMPSSYTGGRRCITENFHAAMTISRVQASPVIITTFTCNPKWPEIMESLEPGQKTVDRADICSSISHEAA